MEKPHIALNSRKKRWVIAVCLLIINVLLLNFLGQFFPYTGLAAILFIPLIFAITLLIICFIVRISRNLSKLPFICIWTFTALTTTFLILLSYPQEFRPNVLNQIIYSISAINNIDKIPKSDLDLPFKVDDFSRYDCKTIDSQERYVAALYKFRYQIPLDSTFHIYREDKRNAISGEQSIIIDIDDIPNKLNTKHEKLIWLVLKTLYK
ncbi:MAG: hypothetical protein ACOYO1_05460 [Bacteroidales bacterium]